MKFPSQIPKGHSWTLLLLGSALAGSLQAATTVYIPTGSGNSVDHAWWGMGIGMFIMLMVAVLAMVGVFAIAKWMTGSSRRNRPDPSGFAETSLQEPYARGTLIKLSVNGHWVKSARTDSLFKLWMSTP